MYRKTKYNTGLVKSPYSSDYTNETFNEYNYWFPVDIQETENEYTLIADLPGFKKENIHLSYDRDHLHIHGYQANEVDEIGSWLLNERINRSFNRTFTLLGVDENKIESTYNDGILQVKLPKNFTYDTSVKQIIIK